MSKELEKAKAKKLQRTGLPLGEPKQTTQSDVDKARQKHTNRTYGNDVMLSDEEIADEKKRFKESNEEVALSPDEARAEMIKRKSEAHKKKD